MNTSSNTNSKAPSPASAGEGWGGGKVLIFSAPSGSGKSTIIDFLRKEHPELNLAFSISATTRKPRGEEKHGVEYYFLSHEEFQQHVDAGDFLEFEQVYQGDSYGTLRQQAEDKRAEHNVVFDVDVKGGCNIKKFYGDRALSIFIQPPSIDELRRRLVGRGTDAPERIEVRLARAAEEMTYAPLFDRIIVNDDLDTAKAETLHVVEEFLK